MAVAVFTGRYGSLFFVGKFTMAVLVGKGTVIGKGPDCCLNPGLISHAGIMFIQFKHQIGFIKGFHDLLKIVHPKGIW